MEEINIEEGGRGTGSQRGRESKWGGGRKGKEKGRWVDV